MEGNISPSPAHKEKRPFPEGFRAPASFLSRSHRRGPFFPPRSSLLIPERRAPTKPRGHARVPRTFAGQRLLTPCRTHFFAPAVRHGPAAVPESAYRKKNREWSHAPAQDCRTPVGPRKESSSCGQGLRRFSAQKSLAAVPPLFGLCLRSSASSFSIRPLTAVACRAQNSFRHGGAVFGRLRPFPYCPRLSDAFRATVRNPRERGHVERPGILRHGRRRYLPPPPRDSPNAASVRAVLPPKSRSRGFRRHCRRPSLSCGRSLPLRSAAWSIRPFTARKAALRHSGLIYVRRTTFSVSAAAPPSSAQKHVIRLRNTT